jgi:hypothetical protein
MGWMRVPLSPAEIAAGREGIIQDAFANVWTTAGAPPDAVMYTTPALADEHFCYFTPAAVIIARQLLSTLGGVDCPEPDLAELVVLVRNDGAQG